MSVELTILIEKGDDGFWIATIPEIPGAFSQGKTKAQAKKNAIEAMLELMEYRRQAALTGRDPLGTVERFAIQP
jgi:predicted RNase H-like HicB family nuclease